MPTGNYIRTAEYRKKLSQIAKEKGFGKWMKGRKLPEEIKRKVSATMKGKLPKNFYEIQKLGQQSRKNITGIKHHNWKGEKVGYIALHDWVSLHKGKPEKCEHCNNPKGRFEWANKSHEYKRDLDDWLRLCTSCHIKYDKHYRILEGESKSQF